MNYQQYLSVIVTLLLVRSTLADSVVSIASDSWSPRLANRPLLLSQHPYGPGLGGRGVLRSRKQLPAKVSAFLPLLRSREVLTDQAAVHPQRSPGQTTTLLPNGRLLLLGGETPSATGLTATVVTPDSTQVAAIDTTPMLARSFQSATVLPNGFVLIFGGMDAAGNLTDQAVEFDPASSTFSPVVVSLPTRAYHSATLLPNGKLLIIGGVDQSGTVLSTIQLWDYKTDAVTRFATDLLESIKNHKASLLADGTVLVEGGYLSNGAPATQREVVDLHAGTVALASKELAEPDESIHIVRSLPEDGAVNVGLNTMLSVQMSSAVKISSLTDRTIALSLATESQPVETTVVGAEGGELAFIQPGSPLLPNSRYTLSVSGGLFGT